MRRAAQHQANGCDRWRSRAMRLARVGSLGAWLGTSLIALECSAQTPGLNPQATNSANRANSTPHSLTSSATVPSIDSDQIQQWVDNLSSPDFEAREVATQSLRALGERAVPALLDQLAKTEELETCWRLREMLFEVAVHTSDSRISLEIAHAFSKQRGVCQRDFATSAALLSSHLKRLRNELAVARLREAGATTSVTGFGSRIIQGQPFIGGLDVPIPEIDSPRVEQIDWEKAPQVNPFAHAVPGPRGPERAARPLEAPEIPVFQPVIEAEIGGADERPLAPVPEFPPAGERVVRGRPLEDLEQRQQPAPEFEPGNDLPNVLPREADPNAVPLADLPIQMPVPLDARVENPQIVVRGKIEFRDQRDPIQVDEPIRGDLQRQDVVILQPVIMPPIIVERGGETEIRIGSSGTQLPSEQPYADESDSRYPWLNDSLEGAVRKWEQQFAPAPSPVVQSNRFFGGPAQVVIINNGVLQAIPMNTAEAMGVGGSGKPELPKFVGSAGSLEQDPNEMEKVYYQSRTVVLDQNWRGSDEDWEQLASVEGLLYLQINDLELNDAALQSISRCDDLTNLAINRCRCDYQKLMQALEGRRGLNVMATGTGRMGIYADDQFDLAGCLIGQIVDASPAARAGLQPGDRIERINGVATPDFTHLALYVAFRQAGEKLQVQVLRGSRRAIVEIELEPR